jgi:DNA-binding TFAR19-related protein (PDSD5 family)
MGIANYTNLSELMNEMLKTGLAVSISDLAQEAEKRMVILASEGELADKSDLENGFIALVDALYRAGVVKPDPANETESHLIRLYESGKLAENGYGEKEGDQFLEIKWKALTNDLPVISNLNL